MEEAEPPPNVWGCTLPLLPLLPQQAASGLRHNVEQAQSLMLAYKVCRVIRELVQVINCRGRIGEQQSMRKCDRCRAWICADAGARYILFGLGLGLFNGETGL